MLPFDPTLFHPSILLLVPPLILTLYAQFKVKSTFAKYSEVGTRSGLSGAEVAARILRDSSIPMTGPRSMGSDRAVGIEPTHGTLTDHYDPRSKVLRLSEPVYGGRSIAALGVAAHEVGHAIQHDQGYGPLALRSMIYPVTNIGSSLAWPLFIIGFLFQGGILMQLGIALFMLAVFFTVVTLPVEFNASRRALAALETGGYLTTDEMRGARKVLNAAALTYVAAAAMAIMQLLRMILIARGRD